MCGTAVGERLGDGQQLNHRFPTVTVVNRGSLLVDVQDIVGMDDSAP
jgi:hypothetical protein